MGLGTITRRRSPSKIEAMLRQAKTVCASGDWDGGIRIFQKVLDVKPGHLEATKMLAVAFFHLEDYRGASAYVNKAKQLTNNKDGDSIYLEGRILLARFGRHQQLHIGVVPETGNVVRPIRVCTPLDAKKLA